MKVKDVFERLIDMGYEPTYWFHEDVLIIDPDDLDPVEDFKAVSDFGLKALRDGPFTEYDVSETESNEILEDIEEKLRDAGIDPEAEVDGYFVYYDTMWDQYYPLILVRNWGLNEEKLATEVTKFAVVKEGNYEEIYINDRHIGHISGIYDNLLWVEPGHREFWKHFREKFPGAIEDARNMGAYVDDCLSPEFKDKKNLIAWTYAHAGEILEIHATVFNE